MLRLSLALLCALVLVSLAPATAGAQPTRVAVTHQIEQLRSATWRWQTLMGKPRTPSSDSFRRGGLRYRLWVRELWRNRAARVRRLAQNPPHERQWRCIHRYERDPRQGWRTNTGNGYYGGLQMDLHFQRYFAPRFLLRKGTADRWTPTEQMWVAERAYRVSGFHPWPNTARACGLLRG